MSKIKLNDKITNLIWKHIGVVAGTNQLTLPNSFTELLIETNAGNNRVVAIIPKVLLSPDFKTFNIGGRYTFDNGLGVSAYISSTKFYLEYFYYGKTNHTDEATTEIYYR